VPIPASLRRFWPGLVGAGIALAFVAVVLVTPHIGGGSCMESYPAQCPVVEVEGSGFAATCAALTACVLVLFLSSTGRTSMVRTPIIVAGFIALVIVVIVGANVSLAHSVELRY
jgi:hypothetical protein